MIGPEDTPETEEEPTETTHSDDWGDTETESTDNE